MVFSGANKSRALRPGAADEKAVRLKKANRPKFAVWQGDKAGAYAPALATVRPQYGP